MKYAIKIILLVLALGLLMSACKNAATFKNENIHFVGKIRAFWCALGSRTLPRRWWRGRRWHISACFLMFAVIVLTQFGRLSQNLPAGSHSLDLEAWGLATSSNAKWVQIALLLPNCALPQPSTLNLVHTIREEWSKLGSWLVCSISIILEKGSRAGILPPCPSG